MKLKTVFEYALRTMVCSKNLRLLHGQVFVMKKECLHNDGSATDLQQKYGQRFVLRKVPFNRTCISNATYTIFVTWLLKQKLNLYTLFQYLGLGMLRLIDSFASKLSICLRLPMQVLCWCCAEGNENFYQTELAKMITVYFQ